MRLIPQVTVVFRVNRALYFLFSTPCSVKNIYLALSTYNTAAGVFVIIQIPWVPDVNECVATVMHGMGLLCDAGRFNLDKAKEAYMDMDAGGGVRMFKMAFYGWTLANQP